ncbi:hypothetical protein RclHR1_10570008 [Rhizophagus clarus]|uniref:Uncharacterized protein n=1 Tax=Rhizophagus clarus TaxID=94130 RepID=A0A2Z6Q1X2_9GLOM|nr:hypothetical protein RclHR1_10570008 [Rhizophagus clarus]
MILSSLESSHQEESNVDPLPASPETSTNTWKLVLTKNQKKKLKKQEKRAEKAKLLQENATLNSSTASPDSTLDSHKPILSQPLPQPSAYDKRCDKSDDKTASLTIKKRKSESSTGDNNLIITGYQLEENDKNLTLDLVVYDIPAKWTNYQLLSELNKWGKVVSVSTRVQKKYQTARVRLTPNHNCLKAYNNGDWTVSLSSIPVRWFPAAWFLSERNNLQSFKIIQEQDGTRTLIGYFATWDALSRKRQPKATGSGSNSSSHKKAGSSPVLTGSNRTPLGSRKSCNNNHENNTNSFNLAQSQKPSGRSTSSNMNKGQRKSGNGHMGNFNKVEIKHLLEQLISLCC